jgi:glycosyltransferase involved in cell wall biosynthesis
VRVLLVSGIFPPDIGGPATHVSEIRAELLARGHTVETLSLTDAPQPVLSEGVVRFPRAERWPTRNARTLAWIVRHARRVDVIYATGLAPVAVAAGRLARCPVIVKIVGDAAWERGSRLGLTRDSFDRFQESRSGGPRLRAMRAIRNWSVRHATAVVAPSEHLAQSIRRWAPRSSVVVVPNGARASSTPDDAPRRSRSGLDLLFVGRLVPVKRVDLLLEAVAQADSACLEIVGDGPELDRLQALAVRLGVDDRVSFAGVLDHEKVLRRVAVADVLVLASSHEGLPHVVLEALVAGTPVVTSPAGGVAEVLTDEVDGLLVPGATPRGFAAAFRRLEHDPALLARLGEGAAATGLDWQFESCADRLEALMRTTTTTKLPRAVFVARARMSIPPRPDDERKYELHGRHIRTVIVCPATRAGITKPGGATVVGLPQLRTPVLGTAIFYTVAPIVALSLAGGRRQTAIICQSPYEGFGILALRKFLPRRLRPPVMIELHGDWRTATRLYGSSRRRFVSGAADRMGLWALRRADRVRPVSEALGHLARESGYLGPLDRFIAFSDYSMFLEHPVRPLPDESHALFIGALERSKAPDVLLDAWPDVLRSAPEARLTIVGSGSLEQALNNRLLGGEFKASVRMLAPMLRPDLRCLMDSSSLLVVPSRSEGLGRIALEAMARGRPVVASRVGGLAELVADGRNGRLVAPEDPSALAEALVELLSDRTRAQTMGTDSRRRAVARDPLREYEGGIARMAEWIRAS